MTTRGRAPAVPDFGEVTCGAAVGGHDGGPPSTTTTAVKPDALRLE